MERGSGKPPILTHSYLLAFQLSNHLIALAAAQHTADPQGRSAQLLQNFTKELVAERSGD